MALTRSDHKRIALNVAGELKRELSKLNGERVLAKHKARLANTVDTTSEPDDDDVNAALSDMDADDEEGMPMPMPARHGDAAAMHKPRLPPAAKGAPVPKHKR